MHKQQQMVAEFHERFEVPTLPHPQIPSRRRCDLRIELIREEFEELQEAVADNDIVGVADALGDIAYVVYGAALEFGIDMEPVFHEIHRSNMSKLHEGRVLRREDGKVVKSPNYSPADVAGEIEKQKARATGA